MKYFVYILKSNRDNKRYIGFTADIKHRLIEHKSGYVKSTRNRRPLQVIHLEEFDNKVDARQREIFFKSGKGREYLKNLGV